MSLDAGFDLCLIVDGSSAHMRAVERLLPVTRGRIAVQLRMKAAAPAAIRAAARTLKGLTDDTPVLLFLNTDIALARELCLDGVQLPAAEVASLLRPPGGPAAERLLKIGASCHDAAEIARARRLGANFVVLSPFAAVPGKGPALGAEAFGSLARACSLPVVALGGLHPGNVAEAARAGASAIACIRGVLDAADPALAACRLLDAMRATR